MTSLNINYPFKDPFSKHILEYWVLELQYMNGCVCRIQSLALPFRRKRWFEPSWEHLGSRVKVTDFSRSFCRTVRKNCHVIEWDQLEKITGANDIVLWEFLWGVLKEKVKTEFMLFLCPSTCFVTTWSLLFLSIKASVFVLAFLLYCHSVPLIRLLVLCKWF